ncbi:RidA family protein [Nocardiopsis xinjiangensis]|uniref:RidA family protein n=1 Tax=Nocardiopsis xinjiangensis TaxID=124285 RepID=UPI0004767052|nr:RidA family protein [Nocardiopsis xinjiangensis]
MPRTNRLNPPRMHQPPGYHHVTVVEAGRLAYLSGQCPLGLDGNVVEGGLWPQVNQMLANTMTVLEAVEASPADVVRSAIYVVSDESDLLSRVWFYLLNSAMGSAFTSSSTLLGVNQLGYSGQLVEVDLTVALPD